MSSDSESTSISDYETDNEVGSFNFDKRVQHMDSLYVCCVQLLMGVAFGVHAACSMRMRYSCPISLVWQAWSATSSTSDQHAGG